MQEKKDKKVDGSKDPKKGLETLKEILAKRKKDKKSSTAKSKKKISLGIQNG